MILDISNNILAIDDSSAQLRPNQVSQIHFWGFVKIPGTNTYELSSRRIDTILPKLCKYLDREGVPYTLSQSSQEYLSDLQRTLGKNERIKVSGKEFKDGEFDTTKFDEFCSFVHNNISRIHQTRKGISRTFELY